MFLENSLAIRGTKNLKSSNILNKYVQKHLSSIYEMPRTVPSISPIKIDLTTFPFYKWGKLKLRDFNKFFKLVVNEDKGQTRSL